MSNLAYIPLEDDYLQELTATLGDLATDVVVNVDTTPVYLPVTTDTIAILEPGTTRAEAVLVDSYDVSAGTITIKAGGRGQDLYFGDARTTKRFEHPAGSEIIISDNYLFWSYIQTAINSKLDNTGGNTTTTFDLDLVGSAFRIRKDGNDMKFTDDNQSEVSLSTLASASGVNDKVKISVADTTSNYLQNKFNVGDGLDEAIGTPAGNETLDVSVDVTDFIDTSYGLTEDTNNIRVNLAATPGLEFSAGALQVKTKSGGGITKDADGLSSDKPTQTFTAYEAVSIDNAVALLPIEVEYFAQLTEVDLALGDANARRKYAIKIIPSATTSTLTTMQFRAKEAVNGATTLGNLTISIQTDNAGAPSGTAVTNGTANVITQVTQRTWGVSYAGRTATWAVPPTLTAGTTYWIVFEVAATDAVNYLKIGENSTYDENYLTFTRLTYDLDTTTWGGSATNATPFFWFNTQVKLLGMALCPTDANWGGRTWSFIGFAKAAIVANASGEVYYYLTPDLASLDAGSDYYLSTTAGAITVTPPGGDYANGTGPSAFTYKIGRAISSTLLLIDKGIKSQTISELGPMAATTTRQYIIWFKPRIVKIDASGVSADSFAFSSGYIREDGSDYHVRAGRCTATINDAGGDSTSSLSTAISGSANAIAGAGSLLSKAGFTYTYTESGAESIWVVMEATG